MGLASRRQRPAWQRGGGIAQGPRRVQPEQNVLGPQEVDLKTEDRVWDLQTRKSLVPCRHCLRASQHSQSTGFGGEPEKGVGISKLFP